MYLHCTHIRSFQFPIQYLRGMFFEFEDLVIWVCFRCQYEALKFVSFPTQTVCKAAKVVPTMLMGRFLRNDRRPASDYIMGICLAAGAGLFFFSSQISGQPHDSKYEIYFGGAISGIILMAGYLFFDAFTLNWQKKLFDTKPKISRYQVS